MRLFQVFFSATILVFTCLVRTSDAQSLEAIEKENMSKYKLGEMIHVDSFVGMVVGFDGDKIYYNVNYNNLPAYLGGGIGGIHRHATTANRAVKACKKVTGDFDPLLSEPEEMSGYVVRNIFEDGQASYWGGDGVLLIYYAPQGSVCQK